MQACNPCVQVAQVFRYANQRSNYAKYAKKISEAQIGGVTRKGEVNIPRLHLLMLVNIRLAAYHASRVQPADIVVGTDHCFVLHDVTMTVKMSNVSTN